MFSSDTARWLTNAIFTPFTVWGALEVNRAANALKVSQQIPSEAVAALGFSGCALVVIGGVGIVCNELRNHEAWTLNLMPRSNNKPTIEDNFRAAREPKPEPIPAPFEGLQPITRVDGKPKLAANYNYVAAAVHINKARHIALINCRWHENGQPADLTEATWARNKVSPNGRKIKKFCSRRELNEIKAAWEADGAICRLSAAKSAQHDVQDWQKMDEYARGKAPLPR